MVTGTFRRLTGKLHNSWLLHKASGLDLQLGNQNLRPFFIVSAGRSGTTLLRKKLVNSDYLHIPPESDDFIPSNAIRFVERNADGWENLITCILRDFQSQPFSRYWSAEVNNLEEMLKTAPSGDRSYADVINHLYTFVCKQHKPDLQVWGDKTPYLIFRLDWLRAIFPGARYIHLVRDGRAVVHSLVQSQGYELERAAIRWRDSIRLFEDHRGLVDQRNILEIRYESLVSDPASTLAEVCAFVGIEFSADLLNDRALSLGDDVLPHHSAIRKEINTGSIEKWKIELTKAQIMSLNKILSKELTHCMYAI